MTTTSSDLIKILTQAMDEISKSNEKSEIFSITEQLILDFSHSSTATFFIYNTQRQQLYSIRDNKEVFVPVLEDKSLLGDAFLGKSKACYNYLASEKNYFAEIDNPESIKIKSQILFPIIEDDELIGMVRTNRILPLNKPYTRFDVDMLGSLERFLIKMVNIIKYDNSSSKETIKKSIDTQEITKQIKQSTLSNESPQTPQDKEDMRLFIANIIHDIRTPSNALYGFLELIEEHTKDSRIREFVTHAKDSASFINTLTDSILEKTKEEYVISSKNNTIINTIKFFSSIANLFSANMYDKEINYIISLDPSLPREIEINELKLKRILINLIGNAYKFTPKYKKVSFHVSYHEETHHLNIAISDEGIGIAKEKQKDIFTAFSQAELNTSKEYGGTGLGLSICAKYVKEFKGELKLKSKLGKGSVFYFSVPVDVINEAPSFLKYINSSINIIILDDGTHQEDSQNIISYLKKFGLSSDSIKVSNIYSPNCTHLICFQNLLSYYIYTEIKKQGITLLIVEEEMFSLSQNEIYKDEKIISLNTYYGDILYNLIYSKRKRRILIADDNKINIMLLTSMLELEYVSIETAIDGNIALDKLYKAHRKNETFDIILIDQHMPHILGTKVIERYKAYEKAQNLSPIYTISITGDPNLSDYENTLFDFHLTKPFNKQMVRDSIKNITCMS